MKPDRKQISAALIEHLYREELHSGEAAKYLNLNPCYISMAKSEKSWDAMGKKPWDRLEEWFNTRENIKDFKIPEGEEIFTPKEKTPYVPKIKATGKIKETDEHSPENLIPEAKKENPGKSVKLVINQAEIDALRKEIEALKQINSTLLNKLETMKADALAAAGKAYEAHDLASAVNKYTFVLEDETIPSILARLEKIEKGNNVPENSTATPKGLVIFQRNYFKS